MIEHINHETVSSSRNPRRDCLAQTHRHLHSSVCCVFGDWHVWHKERVQMPSVMLYRQASGSGSREWVEVVLLLSAQ
jgi:hypothetical protein